MINDLKNTEAFTVIISHYDCGFISICILCFYVEGYKSTNQN